MTKGAIMGADVLSARSVARSLRESVPGDIVDCIFGFSAGAAALVVLPLAAAGIGRCFFRNPKKN